MILFNGHQGIDRLLTSSLKLGGGASITAGPAGISHPAHLAAEFVSYAKSKGAHIGMSVEGPVFDVRHSLNRAHYERSVTPVDIALEHGVSNRHAEPLRAAVSAASRSPAVRCEAKTRLHTIGRADRPARTQRPGRSRTAASAPAALPLRRVRPVEPAVDHRRRASSPSPSGMQHRPKSPRSRRRPRNRAPSSRAPAMGAAGHCRSDPAQSVRATTRAHHRAVLTCGARESPPHRPRRYPP